MNKKRSSNIELLRIVAMFMIITYHIFIHCMYAQLNNGNKSLFNHPFFYKRLIFFSVISPFGKIGDVIFILISGYFMINKGKDINLQKTVTKLLSQQGFVALILLLGSSIVFKISRLSTLTNHTLIKMVDANIFNNLSWFPGYYFLIILIAALFLNNYLQKLDQKKYVTFLLVLFALTQFTWICKLLYTISEELIVLVTGIFLYSLGGYIRLYNPFSKIRMYVLPFILVVCFVIVCISAHNITYNNIQTCTAKTFNQDILQFSDFNILPLICGITLFEMFRRINISHSKLINFIGSSTFIVYLIHDNEFFYSFWNANNWIPTLYKNPAMYYLEYFVLIILTFTIGIIMYTFYTLLMNCLPRLKKLILK